jgi:hypothetical protein
MIELMEKLADIREKMLDIKDENFNYKERIRELERKLSLKTSLMFLNGVYWIEFDETKDGPFCQKCQDSDEKLIRLQNKDHGNMDGTRTHFWECTVCNTKYNRNVNS